MLAEILSAHWPAYRAKFGRLIPAEQHAAVRAILRCRTPALGGHRYRCACGREHDAYHSCNHRACPRCGQDDAAAWLARQRTRLLPVPYFLVTFTVPEQLREPIRAAMKPWYGALLKQSAGALQDLAAQPKYLGAELGPTAILQTWTRDLRYHPHVHLLVPGGGLTPNRLRWVRVKDAEYLVPQMKLVARFKGRLKAWLQQAEPELFQRVPAKVWWMKWVADVQPVGSGEAVLKYLAAYLCRPPLHDSQIDRWDSETVTFRLQLSPEKTCVTHIEQGFDFLGQNLRKYGGKLLIQPSKKNTHNFLEKVRQLIRQNRGLSQTDLIRQLNPIVRGWANYHRHVVAKGTFKKVEWVLWHSLWRWARRRHSGKRSRWLIQRYWHPLGGRNRFAADTGTRTPSGKPLWLKLVNPTEISIRRHVKIRGEANPFDARWRAYMEVCANPVRAQKHNKLTTKNKRRCVTKFFMGLIRQFRH